MSEEQWRPSVGERVAIYGEVKSKSCTGLWRVAIDNGFLETQPFYSAELSPLPAPPSPRPAWETLREAADILADSTFLISDYLRDAAAKLEAAAAPKPPTLAEAVRAYHDKVQAGRGNALLEYDTMVEALAREEGK